MRLPAPVTRQYPAEAGLTPHDFGVYAEDIDGRHRAGPMERYFSGALTALKIFGDGDPGRRLSAFGVQTLPGAIRFRASGVWFLHLKSCKDSGKVFSD